MITTVNAFLEDLRGGKMEEAPIVKVEQGDLQGRLVSSPDGKCYYSFQGIPYAKPPLGSLRFKAPQPPEPWEGIRDATSEGNVSAQIDNLISKQYVGDENCLFLNVYTPNLDGEFLPVMVFIHGGGFRFGSGSSNMYGADYLVEKDVVLVTINYRCGPLGFLSLNTPEVPGNAGLKDMVQAIRWVKENIHNFGGNSGNVTVFGESAGGVAVSILTASPLTKNLISKGIIQSGTALNSWGFQNNPLENAKKLAELVGCESDDVDDILAFLTASSVRELVEANEKLRPPELFYTKGSCLFAPVVEKEFPGVEAVLTESFIDILTSGRVADIPIMIGSTTLEFTYEMTENDTRAFIPEDLKIERNSSEAVEIADKIKHLYFKGKNIGVESLNGYFELLSDKLVNIDTHRYVQYLVQVSNKPIYFYKFDYVGELNLSQKLLKSLGLKHAGHLDDLGYLFKNDLQEGVQPSAQDIKMRERMLRLWTNFAKSGNPTPDENHYLTVTWLPVTKDNLYYLNLGSELSLGTNPDKEKMDFWDSLYQKYYKIWEHPKVNNEEAPRKETEVVQEVHEDIPETKEIVEETNEIPEETKEIQEENEIPDETTDIPEETKETIEIPEDKEIPEETVIIEEQAIPPPKIIESLEPIVKEPEPYKAPVKENGSHTNGNHEEFNEVKQLTEQFEEFNEVKHFNGNGVEKKSTRTSNEIKMVAANGVPKDVIRANDPPEDDLPKNIGVNKFVNFFESLGGKK